MLPDFFCIGAQKSGTTTIWQILNAHQDICMAQPRETRFFYDDLLYQEGLQKYEIQHFAHWSGQKRVGEKCPEYFWEPTCAKRIYQNLGTDLQFIVSLRSPAQRAFAQYRHNMAMLRECRLFEQALADEASLTTNGEPTKQISGYLERGFYARQIETYLKYFPSRNFLFLKFETIFENDQKELAAQIYRFLDVPVKIHSGLPFKSGHPKLDQVKLEYYPKQKLLTIATGQKKNNVLKKMLKLPGAQYVNTVYNPSAALIQFASDFNANRPGFNNLDPIAERELNTKYFKEDILALQHLVPFDVSDWLT